jgi:hypothetical protein
MNTGGRISVPHTLSFRIQVYWRIIAYRENIPLLGMSSGFGDRVGLRFHRRRRVEFSQSTLLFMRAEPAERTSMAVPVGQRRDKVRNMLKQVDRRGDLRIFAPPISANPVFRQVGTGYGAIVLAPKQSVVSTWFLSALVQDSHA